MISVLRVLAARRYLVVNGNWWIVEGHQRTVILVEVLPVGCDREHLVDGILEKRGNAEAMEHADEETSSFRKSNCLEMNV